MPEPLRTDRAAVLESLAAQLRGLETTRWGAAGVVSSGSAVLDGLLPEGGFRRGSLVEWLASDEGMRDEGTRDERGEGTRAGEGSGAATLALVAAREALAGGGVLVVIDRARRFYPPAALRLGFDLERMIVVRPLSEADHAWALDQVLRSRGVAAVWCAVERADDHTLRRWQLAAETSGVLGFLLRGAAARGEPSWAELRLGVEPLRRTARGRERRWRVELLRCRSGRAGEAVEVEISGRGAWRATDRTVGGRGNHHETGSVHLASPMAAATTGRRPRRA